MNSYVLIMILSGLVILSYLFSRLAKVSRIPSVLMLMGFGMLITWFDNMMGIKVPDVNGPLKVIGTVGLMLIVLEGALELEISRPKLGMLLRAFFTAAVILGATTFGIAATLYWMNPGNFMQSFVYAIPLSVVSSAIIIPSVISLNKKKSEFLITESIVSDILGILLFDFIVFEPTLNVGIPVASVALTTLVSIGLGAALSYLLVIVLQNLESGQKYFLLLAVLSLILAAGKYFHLPSLLVVLFFGLILHNGKFFFKGPIKRFLEDNELKIIHESLHIITLESSFLIRTFFFIFFGMTMTFDNIFTKEVLLISCLALGIIYLLRLFNLGVISKLKTFPSVLIAPRGLVTILLFYKIPEEYFDPNFKIEILVVIIIVTNLLMMIGLMSSGFREKDLERPIQKDIIDPNNP